MKVLLAKAAHRTALHDSVVPPLGVLYLASTLRAAGRHEVEVADLHVVPERTYAERLRAWRPDVVGISALTLEAGHAHRLAALAREHAPGARVVLGGPHPSGYPEEVIADPSVDVVAVGEGEHTLPELLDALAEGGDAPGASLERVPGLVWRDGRVRRSAPRDPIEDIDAIPHPAWDLVDFGAYGRFRSQSLVGPRRVAPLLTSRACPYRCTYCHDLFGKRFQARSPADVMAEMTGLIEEQGVRSFEIVDDIFNLDAKRARAILEAILGLPRPVRLSFPNGLRGDLLDEDLIDLFARAGTEYVAVSPETATPRLQRQIKKRMKLDRLQRSIEAFADRRVFVQCSYMLGFPGETRAEMEATVRWACGVPSHVALFFLVTPYQGTALSAEVTAAPGPGGDGGTTSPAPFEDLDYFGSDVNLTGTMSTRDLHRATRLAYLRFFVSPRRVLRILRDHPNRGALGALGLLFLRRLLARG